MKLNSRQLGLDAQSLMTTMTATTMMMMMIHNERWATLWKLTEIITLYDCLRSSIELHLPFSRKSVLINSVTFSHSHSHACQLSCVKFQESKHPACEKLSWRFVRPICSH